MTPLVLALVALPAAAATTTFSDSTLSDANWSFSLFPGGNGGTASEVRVTWGGTYVRSIANTVNGASAGTTSTIFSVSIYTPSTYDPASSDPITTIDYAEYAICFFNCFGQGQSTGPAIAQGGKVYISTVFLITGPETSFHPLSLSGLTASNFSLLDPGATGACCDMTQHPDFSATAAPIQFGFYRANGTGVGGGGYALTAGLADWVVTVHSAAAPAAPVPALSGTMLALSAALIVLGLLLMRRRRAN
jgi:hypothetical protein